MSAKDDLIFWGVVIGASALSLEYAYQKLSAEEKAALAYSADLQGYTGGFLQRLLGYYARFRGKFQPGILPADGVTVTGDRPAVPGKYLGNPKNVLGIAGKIRSIENQDPAGIVEVPLFSDTILIDAALENQSDTLRSGIPSARVLLDSVPFEVKGTPVDLPPGAFRQVTLRIPRSFASKYGEMDLALQFSGYTLDRVTGRLAFG